MKQRGFTLIELMVVAIIMMIVLIIILNAFGSKMGPPVYTYGPNGLIEVRCIDGYKFVLGERGNVTQMLDKDGKGMPCNDLVHRL